MQLGSKENTHHDIDLGILDEPFPLTHDQIDFYHDNGFVKLTNVLPAEVLDYFGGFVTDTVMALKKDKGPLEQRDTYGKAFIQVANLWRHDDAIRHLVFSRRLGRIAAELTGADGVRLYHDQALYKEPGGGFTPWHADQYYWPFATGRCTTAWIPLQATPLEMGPLEFSAGSHSMSEGRGLQIGDESERQINGLLERGSFRHVVEPFEVGEVSFHAGWLFHRAGPNRTDRLRKVMTVIYMDHGMVLKEPDNANQQLDWETWCPGATVGDVIDTPLNPLIYVAP